jgi:hypothetical protein
MLWKSNGSNEATLELLEEAREASSGAGRCKTNKLHENGEQ